MKQVKNNKDNENKILKKKPKKIHIMLGNVNKKEIQIRNWYEQKRMIK